MNSSSEFNGEVALVTGAGGGIGRATALAFAAQGAKVVVADRPGDNADETLRLIQSRGGEALFVSVDVTQAAQVEAMVATTERQYGSLNFAVNNAGTEGSARVPLADYDEATWHAVIAVNLSGVFLCMKHELAALLNTRGAIVNMESVAGLSGVPRPLSARRCRLGERIGHGRKNSVFSYSYPASEPAIAAGRCHPAVRAARVRREARPRHLARRRGVRVPRDARLIGARRRGVALHLRVRLRRGGQ